MSKDRPRNLPASVRQRLMTLARSRHEDFQFVLTRYANERILYRLSVSEYAERFVLKGAMLFRLWDDQTHRPTRDLDLLGTGDSSPDAVAQVFREIVESRVEEDGLSFDPDTVSAERIKEDQQYEGVRVGCMAHLGQARIDIQIDVGFGDAVVPRATEVSYPTLLDFPPPILGAYPRESVVAEKFQAMVSLGIANSRMKDFFDLWFLAKRFPFDGQTVCRAIGATFHRRKTPLPSEPPLALTQAFSTDEAKAKQWVAFIKKNKLDARSTLEQVRAFLSEFLLPPTLSLAAGLGFPYVWEPPGPWKKS